MVKDAKGNLRNRRSILDHFKEGEAIGYEGRFHFDLKKRKDQKGVLLSNSRNAKIRREFTSQFHFMLVSSGIQLGVLGHSLYSYFLWLC